ncbi:MAG: hypothetical protein J6S85_00320 [Methanobrevibacter sp.]|nr:hypothetical protein [Methanobrevibacter sp.]
MATMSYDQWKKLYEGMSSSQRQQYNDMLKSNGSADAIGSKYLQQYNNSQNVYTADTTNKLTNSSLPTNTYGDTGGAANATKYSGT